MGILSFGKSTIPIGLDIGVGHFRAAQITPGTTTHTLTNYASIKVPMGAIVEGDVVDVETASQSISQLWKKSGLTGKDVAVGIASQKVVVRLVQMPQMDQAELKNAIQFQAQDYIPIPIEEAIIDAQIVNEFISDDDEKMMEVLLVAAQKDLISNVIQAIEGAGLRPQIVDLSAFAMARSLLSSQDSFFNDDESQGPGEATAIINIGSGLTNIVVIEQGMPRFARVTPMAGNDLTKAISEAIGVSFEEADELKLKVGLPDVNSGDNPEAIPGDVGSQEDIVRRVLDTQFSYFVAEIRRSIDYYLTQATQVGNISKLIISGNGANLTNIAGYLESGLQAKVEVGNPLSQVKISSKLSAKALSAEESSMSIPVGLALRGIL